MLSAGSDASAADAATGSLDPPIGIAFTNSPVAPNGIPLFPVQLVEAGLNFLLFFFLLWFAGKPRPQGRILGAYVIAYAVIRFVLEFLRYDYERGILWVFSTSQWISLILLPIGIWLLARRAKAGKNRFRWSQPGQAKPWKKNKQSRKPFSACSAAAS